MFYFSSKLCYNHNNYRYALYYLINHTIDKSLSRSLIKYMNNTRQFRIIFNIIKCIAFLLVSIVFIYCMHSAPNSNINLQPQVKYFTEGWTMDDQQVGKLPFSYYAKKSKKSLSFFNTIPSNVSNDDIMMFRTKHSETHIYIDGESVYSYGDNKSLPFGTMTGDTCCFVPMKEEYRDKTIEIRVILHSSKAILLDKIVIGRAESVFRYILRTNFWYVLDILILIVASVGTIIVLLIYYLSHVRIDYSFAVYYLLLAFELIVFLYFYSNLFQFQSSKSTTACLIVQIFILLIQCTIVGICKTILRKKGFSVLELISFMIIILMTVLYIFSVIDPVDFITPIMIYAPIVVIYALVSSFKKRKTNALATYMFFDLLVLALAIVIGQIFFYYKNLDTLGVAIFVNGIILFSLGILSIIEKNMVNNSNAVVKSKVYKKMAYLDSMTGLGNRLGFHSELSKIQSDSEQGTPITLIICDLNYLKKTNDIYGHSAGDNLIITAAACLKNAVNEDASCFRLGGDEFGIIVVGPKEKGEQIVQRIHSQIDMQNGSAHSSLSLAIGYSFNTISNKDADYKELYHKADKNMYANKRNMHAERRDS